MTLPFKNVVSTPVRGHVTDDIRQSQDDGGNARNWSNLHILFFLNKFVVKIPWKSHLKIGNPSVLPQRNCNFVSRELRGKVPFLFQARVGRRLCLNG